MFNSSKTFENFIKNVLQEKKCFRKLLLPSKTSEFFTTGKLLDEFGNQSPGMLVILYADRKFRPEMMLNRVKRTVRVLRLSHICRTFVDTFVDIFTNLSTFLHICRHFYTFVDILSIH